MLQRRRAGLLATTALLAALTVVPVRTFAQTWDGETDSDYLTGTNWAGDVAPAAGGAVVLDTDAGDQPTLGAGDTSTVGTVAVGAGTLTVDGNLSTTADTTISGTGAVVVGAAGSISGDVSVLTGGQLTLDGALTGSVTNAGGLVINATSQVDGNVTSSANGGNAGEITGTLGVTGGTFDNAGTVGGATTVDDGVLNLNAGTDLSGVGALTVNGGVVNVNASDTVGTLAGTGGTVAIGAGQTLTAGDATDTEFGGVLDGGGDLSKTGGGTLTLSGTSTLAGSVDVLGGALNLTGAGTIASTVVNVSAGTLITDGDALAAGASLGVSGTGTFTSSGTDSYAGIVQTGGTINGSGVQTLSGAFVQSGGATGGTVDINAATYTQSGGAVLGADSIVTATGAQTLNGGTIAGTLDGGGSVRVQTGTTTVTGTITGGVTVASGTLRIGNSAAIGGTITTTGSVVSYANGVDEASALVIASNTTQLEVLAGESATQSGAVGQTGGARPVEKIGDGTLLLSGSNTYTGATTISAGTLNVTGGAALSDGARVVVAGGATLGVLTSETVGSLSGAGNVALTGILTAGGDNTSTTYSGVASGAGGLTKDGTGTLTVTGANTYTGATLVSDGTLAIGNALALGTAAAGTLVADGATLAVQGGLSVAEAVTLNGSGVAGGGALRSVSGSNTMTGLVTLATDARITTNAGLLTLQGGVSGTDTDLTLGGAGATTVSGAIALGSGSLIKDGAGTVTLSGANTFTGATTVSDGRLVTTVGGTLSDTGLLTVDSPASVQIGASETVGNIAGSGGIVLGGLGAGVTLTAGDATVTTTFSGVISEDTDVGNVTKTGTGTLILTGDNTYTGVTTVDAGTLQVTGSIDSTVIDINGGVLSTDGGGLVAAAAVTNDGTFSLIAGGDETIASVNGSGAVTLSSGSVLALTTGVSAISGDVSGAGGLTVQGTSDTRLSGLLSYSGPTTVNAGALTISATTATLRDIGDLTVDGGSFTADSAFVSVDALSGSGGSVTLATTVGASQLNFGSDGSTTGYSGGVTGAAATSLVKEGTGTTTLTGTVNTAGGITVLDGTLALSGVNTISAITVDGAGRLRLLSDAAAGGAAGQITTTGSVISYGDSVNSATPIVLNSDTTQLEVLGDDAAEQSGAISELGGARPLEKIGTGALTLSGTNTFTGDLTISDGTLAVTGGAAIADVVEVIVGSAATFRLDADEDIGALSGTAADGTVAIGGNVLSIVGAEDTSYAGTMTGTGLFQNDGTGTLTLTGDGSGFTGVMGATNAGAVLALSGAGTTGAAGVGSTAGATFLTDGGALLATNVVLAADGQVTFTGSETIGTLVNGSALGNAAGTVTLTGAGTDLTVTGEANLLNPANINGIDGTIEGAGRLVVAGGTFRVGVAGDVQTRTAIGAGGVVVNDGTMASVSNAGTFTNSFNAVTGATAGDLTNIGAGGGSNAGTLASLTHESTGVFTNTGVVTGTTTLRDGSVVLGAGSDLSDTANVTVDGGILDVTVAETIGALSGTGGTVQLDAGLTAGGNGLSTDFAGVFAGAGAFTKVGGGAMTLLGNSTGQTGAVIVSGGELFYDETGATASLDLQTVVGGRLASDGAAFGIGASVTNAGDFALVQGGSESIAALNGAGSVEVSGGSILTLNTGVSAISGAISGDGGLSVQGTSATILSGTNTYTGVTTVTAGSLDLQNGAAIEDTATVEVNGGTLTVTDAETVGELIANGGVSTLTAVLTTGALSGTAGSVVLGAGSGIVIGDSDGTNASFGGVLSGAGFLQKVGSDTQTLTGLNTYTGGTTASGGVLAITGTGALTTAFITIDAGGSVSTDGGAFAATLGITNTGRPTAVAAPFGLMLTGGGDESIASLNGSGTTDLSAGSILTLNSGVSAITGRISGAGSLVVTGTSATTLTGANSYTGPTDVSGNGTLAVTGAGTLASTDIETLGSGAFSTDGGALQTTAQIVNAGSVTFGGSESIARLNGAGTVALTAGTLTLNSGASVIDGLVSGAGGLTIAGGTTTVSNDANSFTGLTSVNGGALILTGAVGGDLTVTSSPLTVTGGSVAGVTTNNGGTVDVADGTFTGGLNNVTGTVEAEGTVIGDITNAGTFAVTGDITSDAVSSFDNTGTVLVVDGSLENLGSFSTTAGTVTVGPARTLGAGTVSNVGATAFTVTDGRIAGAFNNAGTVVVDGNVTFDGTLTNTGTVDMDDGATNDVLTVAASAANAGTFTMDLNLNTGTADRVDVTGGGVTTALLDFNIPDGRTYIGGPITVFSGAAANSLSGFTSPDLPQNGGIVYSLGQSGGDIQVLSLVNPAVSGVAAAAAVTQSLIATVVNRPTSPFVSGLAAEETCSSGGYARATGGKATVAGTSTSNDVSVTNDVSATYGGVQGGYDFGCFDGRYANGWDGAIGIMGGVNFGSTEQNVYQDPLNKSSAIIGTSGSDFNQSYLGVYAAASRDKVSGDLQLRFDRTEFELTEDDNLSVPGVTLVGFDGAKFDTRTTTFGARFNYRVDLDEEKGISLVPTIGFNYSHTSGDTVEWDGGNQSLELEPFNSTVGFLGATVTRTTVAASGTSATTLFASGNYYHDFSGERDSTYVDVANGVNQAITLDGIGGFGEASIGVNYVKVLDGGSASAKQFNANIRADARFGGNVSEAYSLTAQVRLSF